MPADGVVVTGTTSVNKAAVTGESVPIDKQPQAPNRSRGGVRSGTCGKPGVCWHHQRERRRRRDGSPRRRPVDDGAPDGADQYPNLLRDGPFAKPEYRDTFASNLPGRDTFAYTNGTLLLQWTVEKRHLYGLATIRHLT